MAEHWWSLRFTDVLESYGLGGRMQRGRRYARAGQVIALEVDAGLIAAQVQGSRARPYLVSIRLKEVTDTQWSAIEQELGRRIGLIAALLAGEVPDELEPAFETAGVDLFPSSWVDLKASCNCPDGASPCKHLAAVLYVFADRLDSDPWLLLHWRGRSRNEIMDLLGPRSGPSIAPWWPFSPGDIPATLIEESANDAGRSGAPGPHPGPDPEVILNSDEPAGVPTRLGPLAVDIRGTPITELLGPAYESFRQV